MKTYTFVVDATISMHTDVKAESLEAAIKKAQSRGTQSFCWECSRGAPTEEWVTSGEIDTDPASGPLVDLIVDGESVEAETEFAEARILWSGSLAKL